MYIALENFVSYKYTLSLLSGLQAKSFPFLQLSFSPIYPTATTKQN